MDIVDDVRQRLRLMVGPLIGICSILYFGFHAIHGERGLLTYWRLQQDIAETEPLLEDVQFRRLELERRVRLLRPDSLDPDMLEERARLMLNYGYANEVVVLDREPSS